MKRRSKAEIDAATALIDKAQQALRKDDKQPGFDYQATVRDLRKKFTDNEIARFCQTGKGAVSKWESGKTKPTHPNGERLYILYSETFEKKPPSKPLQE